MDSIWSYLQLSVIQQKISRYLLRFGAFRYDSVICWFMLVNTIQEVVFSTRHLIIILVSAADSLTLEVLGFISILWTTCCYV